MHQGEAVRKRDKSREGLSLQGQTLLVAQTPLREVEAILKAAKISRKAVSTLGARVSSVIKDDSFKTP